MLNCKASAAGSSKNYSGFAAVMVWRSRYGGLQRNSNGLQWNTRICQGVEKIVNALLRDLSMPNNAADEALRLLCGDAAGERLERLDDELVTVTSERDRLVVAIAAGGKLDGLLAALTTRETRQRDLEAATRESPITTASEGVGTRVRAGCSRWPTAGATSWRMTWRTPGRSSRRCTRGA